MAQGLEAFLQRDVPGFGRLGQGGDATKLGGFPGGHGDAGPLATGNRGTPEQHGGALSQRGLCIHRLRPLGHRQRLPGERGLVGFQPACRDDPEIRPHQVPLPYLHDIAGNQAIGGYGP